MDIYWNSISNYSNPPNEYSYLPGCEEPVWILGSRRNSISDRVSIAEDIRSRLWFTYRKGFSPIGGPAGPTSDAGWGCMHRCGQMMMAEALIRIHLGDAWRWNPDRVDPPYLKVLRMFEDRTSALYSFHSITIMGVSEEKSLGSWLGPNTISQVLRKLSTFDKWTNLAVHVTTEDGVIVEEIKQLCRHPGGLSCGRRKSTQRNKCGVALSEEEKIFERKSNAKLLSSKIDFPVPFLKMKSPSSDFADCSPTDVESVQSTRPLVVSLPISKDVDSDCIEIIMPPVVSSDLGESVESADTYFKSAIIDKHENSAQPNKRSSPHFSSSPTSLIENKSSNNHLYVAPTSEMESSFHSVSSTNSGLDHEVPSPWRPLLLIIPLRLGLSDLNPYYIEAVKGLFKLPQCIGILGGRTNHALWLIGYVGDHLLCLDPHTTQQAVSLGMPTPGFQTSDTDLGCASLDGSFHCNFPISLPFARLDPSLAVGFVCRSEMEFDNLCSALLSGVLSTSNLKSSPTIFEIHKQRPNNLPPPFLSNIHASHAWADLIAAGDLQDELSDEFEML